MTETATRPARGAMPKFEADIVNLLIDQGWQFIPGRRGNKHKLVPPDPTKRARYVAWTPSDSRTRAIWFGQLRRSGAILDDQLLERLARRESRRRLRRVMRDSAEAPLPTGEHVPALSTVGSRWWLPEPELPEPEPPAPKVRVRVAAPPSPDDARGTTWTLGQARDMIRQGYHAKKVIQKTGWGLNHLRDLIDSTGYYNFT